MRGTEIVAEAPNTQDQGQSDGARGVPGGSEPDRSNPLSVGENGTQEIGGAPDKAGERRNGPYYVYALVDPRDGQVFYIGFTSNHPRHRLRDHRHNFFSAARPTIRAIAQAGGSVGMYVLGTYDDKQDALDAEARFIASTPGLVNRQGYSSEWFPDNYEDATTYEPDPDFVEHEYEHEARVRRARLKLKERQDGKA